MHKIGGCEEVASEDKDKSSDTNMATVVPVVDFNISFAIVLKPRQVQREYSNL